MKVAINSAGLRRDSDVAYVRRCARLIAAAAGATVRNQTRYATAVSEIARNTMQYAGKGTVEFAVVEEDGRTLVETRVADEGPGIAGLDAILAGKYQSDSGMGLGLRGARSLVDHFDIRSGDGGTVVRLALEVAEPARPNDIAKAAADNLAKGARESPLAELAEQNRALIEEIAEKEFLIRELHHRIKNNLAIISSLARMQAKRVSEGPGRDELIGFANRIQSFAIAHNHLYRADHTMTLDLGDHLTDLCRHLTDALGVDDRVSIECTVSSLRVPPDTALELGIIVNELVTNSCKHAFPDGREGRIEVEAVRTETGIRVVIRDNGIGIADPDDVLTRSKSLGWRVLHASVTKLGGDVSVTSEDGLSVTLDFPLEAGAEEAAGQAVVARARARGEQA